MQINFADIIKALQNKKIITIGDMVADIYLYGRISRISREAPVLVLEQANKKTVAGGAANVAGNIATLGGSSYALGVVGADENAENLAFILDKKGVKTKYLTKDSSRPTIAKTRIIAGGRATVSQQIVRVDNESSESISKELEAKILAALDEILPEADGIVLSDYGSGTITEAVREKVISYARENNIPSIVDSRYDISRFAGIGYVKQNDAELAAAVGRELKDEQDIAEAADELMEKLNADGVLVTRGELGMILFEENGNVTNIPVSDKSEVYDVSGAGDTCVATMILALAADIEPPAAAFLSNIASGIAVRKLGTATVSSSELYEWIKAHKRN